MRVLHVGLSRLKGGIESYVLNYARALRDEEIIFDYADTYGEGIAIAGDAETLGGRIFTLPDFRRNATASQKAFKELIANEGYGIVHINMLSCANIGYVKAAVDMGVRVIVHSHNSQAVGLLRRTLHRLNAGRMNRLPIIRLSCGEMAGKWMFGDRDFRVIPNAVDTDRFGFDPDKRAKIRSELGYTDNDTVMCAVGRLSSVKNPLYMAEVLSAAQKKNKNTRLLVIGSGPMENDLNAKISELGLTDSFKYIGNQADVAPYYSAADALIMPSLFEGFPVVAVEAQCAGLPCVLSDRISGEVALTDLVTYRSIDAEPGVWADAALASAGQKSREEYSALIADTDYSITRSAGILKDIYKGK